MTRGLKGSTPRTRSSCPTQDPSYQDMEDARTSRWPSLIINKYDDNFFEVSGHQFKFSFMCVAKKLT